MILCFILISYLFNYAKELIFIFIKLDLYNYIMFIIFYIYKRYNIYILGWSLFFESEKFDEEYPKFCSMY
jgi:hypothetical protein